MNEFQLQLITLTYTTIDGMWSRGNTGRAKVETSSGVVSGGQEGL